MAKRARVASQGRTTSKIERKASRNFYKLRLAFRIEGNKMQIEDWREEIDAIDQELLRLLNQRARVAQKIGALKRTAGLPICDPERERHVLTNVQNVNNGPLDESAIAKLFRRIIRESRRVEKSRQQEVGSGQ